MSVVASRFGIVIAVGVVALGAACGSSAKTAVSTSTPTTTATTLPGIHVGPDQTTLPAVTAPPVTAAPAATAGPTQCAGLKDPLPKGSPPIPLTAEPAPTALVKNDLTVGTGAVVPEGATITANYVGIACSTGKIFDSSYAHGQAVSFPLSQVIPGWTQGIPGMKVGGVRLLSIPAALAYADQPPPGSGIGVNDPLYFLVQVTALG